MSDPEPMAAYTAQVSPTMTEGDTEKTKHQSNAKVMDALVEDAQPAAPAPTSESNSGENESTPRKERDTVVDMVTTPADEAKKVGSAKKKSAKKSSSKNPATSGSKSPYIPKKNGSGKLSYLEMVHEAIANLKDRTGSSVPAIQKWIKGKYPDKASKPDVFKNNINKAIKAGVKEKRLIQIKASYKINTEWTNKQKAVTKAKEAAKKKAALKIKKELEKKRAQSNEEADKRKAEEDEKKRQEAMTPEQRAAEKKTKAKAEILRKRRLPMEDTKLHAENKEYGIKNPDSLNRKPALPFTMACLVPPHLRGDNPKWGPVFTASQTGAGDWTETDNDRGLIVDTLHVFHFFMGDVGFSDDKYPVPKFSIKTLLYALDEIIIGNSKTAKSLPPLISHLFLTALRVLTAPESTEGESKSSEYIDPVEAQLQKDLARIGLGLNAISWSQILFFYIDLMERYYLSDSSLDTGVMAGDDDLDMSYLWDKSREEDAETDAKMESKKDSSASTRKYRGYIGNPKGALCKLYTKLSNQTEAWNLTAEELMAALRSLTDDILSRRVDLANNITARGVQLDDLKRAKNQALLKFRKARNDFEGPKKPTKKKADDDAKVSDDGNNNNDSSEITEKDEPFKPKISKKAFLVAEKQYHKSLEAYDNGILKLVSRTEPLGFDRNFNSYYCFVHDPEMMHVEQLKQTNLPPELKRLGVTLNPSSSWHFIDTKPLYDQFLGCLDVRGTRENELYEVSSSLTILKRKLQDDKKDNTRAAARLREKEALEKRLENARTACDGEEGRRSGRLAGQAIDEVRKLESELKQMLEAHEEEESMEKLGRERASDYTVLTGLEIVTELGNGKHDAFSLQYVPCHELWMSKKAGGNGTLHAVAEALLEMEAMCDELSPWKRSDMTRDAWRKQLSDVSTNFARECEMKLGPSPKETVKENANDGDSEKQSPAKKPRVDDRPMMANIASVVRTCLKELELRVFELSGEKMAFEEADAAEDMVASDDEGDKDDTKQRRNCWKRKVNALKQIPTIRYAIIRDIIVAAITVARKSHLNQVAADLKVALQLHRPQAAGEAKAAALGVLDKYGGYEEEDNDDMDLDEIAGTGEDKAGEEVQATVSSFLCDEVIMMTGSIGGNEDADQCDWRDVLKTCKSISRLAAAAQMFLSKADDVIYRVQEEKETLDVFLGTSNKRASKSKTSKRKFDLSSPVWADCKVTAELVKGKVKDYPWWPARVCEPYDPVVAQSVAESGHTLISFIGESINYLVPQKNIKPFSPELEETEEKYDAETMDKLNESTAMAKSIWKKQNPGLMSPWSKKSKSHFIEEKKSES